LIDVFLQSFFEARHDGRVMVSRPDYGVRLVVAGQAMDHGVEHFLFERPCDLWALDQLLSFFCKTAGVPKQAPESQRFGARGAVYPARVRRRDRLSVQCVAALSELLG
jgi:hypothetical protein